jgi:hypothetical protein
MSDELNEEQETLEPETEVTPEEVTPEPEAEPDIEELKAQATKAAEYKQYADKTKAEIKELKKTLQTKELPQDINERLERQDLRIEGYSPTETDFLMRNGGRKALDDKLVLAAIEATRKEAKSKEATPTGTGKSTVFQKFTEQDLRKMPAEELEKIIPQ